MQANVFQCLCFTMLTNVREEAQSGAETHARKSRVRAMVSLSARTGARGPCTPLSWGYERAGTGETEREQSATELCHAWPSPPTSSSKSWDQASHFQSCSPTPYTHSPGAERRDLHRRAEKLFPHLNSLNGVVGCLQQFAQHGTLIKKLGPAPGEEELRQEHPLKATHWMVTLKWLQHKT